MVKMLVLAIALTGLVAASALAQARCPAGTSGCTVETAPQAIQDRAVEGARRVITNPDGVGRAREAGKTVRDCLNCGMDAVRDGANRLTGSQGGSK